MSATEQRQFLSKTLHVSPETSQFNLIHAKLQDLGYELIPVDAPAYFTDETNCRNGSTDNGSISQLKRARWLQS